MWRSIAGNLRLKLVGADIAVSLNQIADAGIILHETIFLDDITAEFLIDRVKFRLLRNICKSRGDSLSIIHHGGVYWNIKNMLKRPILVIGVFLFAVLSLYLPQKVLFVRVEGNCTIPSNKILEAASRSGIYFGSDRKTIRNEIVKNALLEKMPELQWVGVNTRGCVAVITVREREVTVPEYKKHQTSSIIASRDGVVVEHTVVRGSLSCAVGQAVQKGQVLISGYTDCGLSIRAEHAEGDIFAHTERKMAAITLRNSMSRSKANGCKRKYGMILGKKRINFYKGSGISDASCVRMYEENYISLPGGFVLPIAFTKEVLYSAELVPETVEEDAATTLLSDIVLQYLRSDMVAGRLLRKEESFKSDDELIQLNGRYACLEMIGIQRYEEIIKPYGTHN